MRGRRHLGCLGAPRGFPLRRLRWRRCRSRRRACKCLLDPQWHLCQRHSLEKPLRVQRVRLGSKSTNCREVVDLAILSGVGVHKLRLRCHHRRQLCVLIGGGSLSLATGHLTGPRLGFGRYPRTFGSGAEALERRCCKSLPTEPLNPPLGRAHHRLLRRLHRRC